MAGPCALPPTRETERVTSMAKRNPEAKSHWSKTTWPSVMEMRLVGM
jgi:hypothetical protein